MITSDMTRVIIKQSARDLMRFSWRMIHRMLADYRERGSTFLLFVVGETSSNILHDRVIRFDHVKMQKAIDSQVRAAIKYRERLGRV